MKKCLSYMTIEDLLVNYESLIMRFCKEDDFGLSTDKTEDEIEFIKEEIYKRVYKNS